MWTVQEPSPPVSQEVGVTPGTRDQRRRKRWMLVGPIGAALLSAGCFLTSPFALMPGAKAYADRVIGRAFVDWEAAAMTAELAPTAQAGLADRTKHSFAGWSRRLGALRSHTVTSVNVNAGIGKATTGRVTADATYEKGPASIELELVRSGNSWKVVSWTVRSSAPPASPGVLWSDDFEDPSSDGCSDPFNGPEGAAECSGGELRLVLLNNQPHTYMHWPLGNRYADAALAIDARLVGSAEQRVIGIGCRDQGPDDKANYQFVLLPARGEAALYRMGSSADGDAAN